MMLYPKKDQSPLVDPTKGPDVTNLNPEAIDWDLSAAMMRIEAAFAPRIKQACWGVRRAEDLPTAGYYWWSEEEIAEVAVEADCTPAAVKQFLDEDRAAHEAR